MNFNGCDAMGVLLIILGVLIVVILISDRKERDDRND
jgi:hypothetical protein